MIRFASMASNELTRIDDPVEASFAAWPEEEGNAFIEVAIATLSPIFDAAHLLHAVEETFSARSRYQRAMYLLNAMRLKFREINSRMQAVEEKFRSPQFMEAVYLAMEETSRTLNKEKVNRFAAILANALRPDEQVDSPIDLSTLIRDISQLTDEDIRVLGILHSVYADVIAHQPNMHDPNAFTEKMDELRRAITNSQLHTDDFRAICERLSGFGLAAEVLRNTSRMGLNDYCYRPTRRGLRLLRLLQ